MRLNDLAVQFEFFSSKMFYIFVTFFINFMELLWIAVLLSAKYKVKFIYLARIFSSAMIISELAVALNCQLFPSLNLDTASGDIW
jgi:hypothetical protein